MIALGVACWLLALLLAVGLCLVAKRSREAEKRTRDTPPLEAPRV